MRDRTLASAATSAFIVNRTMSRDNIESRDSGFSKRNSPLAQNNRISRMQNQIIHAITTRDDIPQQPIFEETASKTPSRNNKNHPRTLSS